MVKYSIGIKFTFSWSLCEINIWGLALLLRLGYDSVSACCYFTN